MTVTPEVVDPLAMAAPEPQPRADGVAELRGQVAALAASVARLEAFVARRAGADPAPPPVPQVTVGLDEAYSADPMHDQRVVDAVMAGASRAAVRKITQDVAREYAARGRTAAGMVTGPPRPGDYFAADKRAAGGRPETIASRTTPEPAGGWAAPCANGHEMSPGWKHCAYCGALPAAGAEDSQPPPSPYPAGLDIPGGGW